MNASARPDKTALICDNRRLTYRDLDTMSNRMANAFIKNGLKDDDRILLYLLNSVELAISIFAALKANLIFSIVDYANTIETLTYIAADCSAAAIVTYEQQAEAAGKLLQDIPSLQLAVITGKEVDDTQEGIISFDKIQSEYDAKDPQKYRINLDLAYLLYTSGSTGSSKGVLTTHRSSLFTIESGMEQFNITEDDIHAIPLPLSFAPGLNQFLQTLRAGATVLLERSFAFPPVTLKKMAKEKATGLAAVPTILAMLVEMDLNRYDLSSLRYIISSGAALAPGTIEKVTSKFPSVLLYSMYGMAEASFILCLDPSQLNARPASVGKPFPGTDSWIVKENGLRAAPGEEGELITRGGHVRSGYWNDPETSSARFKPAPLLGEFVCNTGDIFRTDDEGYFYFVARSDEIIKSGAKKVVPREIENALYKLDGIIEAAAVGIPDPVLGKVIKAFVVLNQELKGKISAEDILRYCAESLEAYKVPRMVEIRDSLPKTAGGKIKKIILEQELTQ